VNSDIYQAGIRDRLQATLGLSIEVARISFPRPGDLRFDGLRVIDPASSRTIAEIRSIRSENDGHNTLLTASQVDLDAAFGDQWWVVILQQFHRHAGDSQSSWRLVADEVSLHYAGGQQSLTNFSAQLKPALESNSLSATCRLTGSTSPEPISFVA